MGGSAGPSGWRSSGEADGRPVVTGLHDEFVSSLVAAWGDHHGEPLTVAERAVFDVFVTVYERGQTGSAHGIDELLAGSSPEATAQMRPPLEFVHTLGAAGAPITDAAAAIFGAFATTGGSS